MSASAGRKCIGKVARPNRARVGVEMRKVPRSKFGLDQQLSRQVARE
jgi:hypothetical protein